MTHVVLTFDPQIFASAFEYDYWFERSFKDMQLHIKYTSLAAS
jgi:hypothetical protein